MEQANKVIFLKELRKFSIKIKKDTPTVHKYRISKFFFITIIPLLILITVFSLTAQDSFGETRQECRSSKGSDPSLTPVERMYALKTCSFSGDTISPFQKIYSEELHNECPRRVPHDTTVNHIARLNDLEKCNRLQKFDSSLESQKITKFSKFIIPYCDEKYEVYQLVGAKNMFNQAGIYAEECLMLYSAPMWNSKADDRYIQLHHFIVDEIKQSLEEGKDIRQKSIEEAIVSRPILTKIKGLFDEQKEKIEYLENQLQEKNVMPNYFQQDFFNKKFEDCLRIIYNETFSLKEKIDALTDCSEIETTKPIAINNKKILQYSKNAVQFCEESHEFFLILGEQDYYNSIKNPLTRKCVLLYKDPIWNYNQHDRTQVLEIFAYYKILKDLNDTAHERKNSVAMANLNAGRLSILADLYQYQEQKIEILENLLKAD